ncbi:MAG: FecR family protein [Phormidesmis sp. FL-bin-119]|nr:FecR family protein [Pedobacter sp.]
MNENDKILITKYITKEANEEEIAMVKYLIESSIIHEEFYVQSYEAWQKSIYYNISSIDYEKAYSKFLSDVSEEEYGTVPLFNRSFLAIAGSIIFACLFGLYFYNSRSNSAVVAEAVDLKEITVPNGSTKKVVLSDGTKITINMGSSLKIEPGFGKSSRVVHLNGEAYFDIAKNPIPFIVNTDQYTIRDIGTIFNVKAYADDVSFETLVIEGEVEIEGKLRIDSDKPQKVSVKKQQIFKINYASAANTVVQTKKDFADIVEVKIQKISSAQAEVYTGWTEDLLVFEGKTFSEIIKIMERRYDVEINMEEMKFGNYEYTGSFRNVNEVEKALKILKKTTDIEFEKNGRVVTIREKRN